MNKDQAQHFQDQITKAIKQRDQEIAKIIADRNDPTYYEQCDQIAEAIKKTYNIDDLPGKLLDQVIRSTAQALGITFKEHMIPAIFETLFPNEDY